jgi:hypothetical protein
MLAVFAYLTAPWVLRVFAYRRWKWMPLAAYVAWIGASGLYQAWWLMVNPSALHTMGEAAIPANWSLYLGLGLILMPRASLKEASWLRP